MQLDSSWTGGIDALVSEANEWLEDLLPPERFGRSKGGVNPRLVRHYTTQRLLSPPLKVGREAHYTRRHLAELLALRRLMADGVGGRALAASLEGRSEDDLLALARQGAAALEGMADDGADTGSETGSAVGGEMAAEGADEAARLRRSALDYIGSVRRAAVLPVHPAPPKNAAAAGASGAGLQAGPLEGPVGGWQACDVWQAAPGVSVMVERQAQLPDDEVQWRELMRQIESALRELKGRQPQR